MMGYEFGSMSGSLLWGLTMLLSMLLPVIVIGGLVYLLARGWERKKCAPTGEVRTQGPLDILKSRYASGEISEHEYTRMRENLLK